MVVEKARTMRTLLFVLVPMVIVLLIAMFTMVACSDDGGNGDNGAVVSNNSSGSDSDIACTTCHDDTSLISGKAAAWGETLHATGMSRGYAGGRAGCAGCHSGGGFSAAIAAGEKPGEYAEADPNPSGQDCRACHQIHTTYTGDDWALETTDAVALLAVEGATYDGGQGNLCANCHQPRSSFDGSGDTAEVDSTHWGPHHGPQAAMLLGVGGAGDTTGSPGMHYQMVDDSCVSCHMGEGAAHSFTPAVTACVSCHADATDFDIDGVQTEVQGMLDELKEALVTAGLLSEEGEPVVGTYPVAQAAALWNYIYIAIEDSSLGVHNPAYTKALLEDSLAAF
jgi:hypothetical protein